jgi:hypothetical protein
MPYKLNKRDSIIILNVLTDRIESADTTIRFYGKSREERCREIVKFWKRNKKRMERVRDKLHDWVILQ